MSNAKDSLGDRMKAYENVSRNYLTRKIPVIIRIDGKSFHTFTRGMEKPFDAILTETMKRTMKYLCENIQGCAFGYTQSDEITLVLTDYDNPTTDAWFGYNIQKMASVSASMATLAFNKIFAIIAEGTKDDSCMYEIYKSKFDKAMFDARVFSIPKDEVCNCLIWRQQDAMRNSIEAVGQYFFSPKELHGKKCEMILEMLSKNGVYWDELPIDRQRGSCCYKVQQASMRADPRNNGSIIAVTKRVWCMDITPPIFTQDRNYIEKWL